MNVVVLKIQKPYALNQKQGGSAAARYSSGAFAHDAICVLQGGNHHDPVSHFGACADNHLQGLELIARYLLLEPFGPTCSLSGRQNLLSPEADRMVARLQNHGIGWTYSDPRGSGASTVLLMASLQGGICA
ncbi:hypothetical protein D3C75_706920 [compost metagenome]